jgi:preprotein translocase SecE subunit
MARTRQKRKAKRREQQLKATRQSAAAKERPMNPAEQAVIDQAEALEAADELEQQLEADGSATEAPPAPAPAQEPAERAERPREAKKPERAREAKKPERRREPKAERREPRRRGRVVNFLVQVWAELRRVQWPDRNQVTQATGVVIVFCFLAGAYLALWDFIFNEFVTWLL